MPKEYEYLFFGFNKKTIIQKIKERNGTKIGTYLFKVQVLIHPFDKEGTYIRVRDEGYKTTMTYKYKDKDSKNKFEEEQEIIINDFNTGVDILLNIGCRKKHYYEKIREIWKIDNTEIVFDTEPGIDDKMEIESKTLKELNNMVKYFNLEVMERPKRYYDLYGLTIPVHADLTFVNVKKTLGKLVKKNKKMFLSIVDEQLKLYTKLLKK